MSRVFCNQLLCVGNFRLPSFTSYTQAKSTKCFPLIHTKPSMQVVATHFSRPTDVRKTKFDPQCLLPQCLPLRAITPPSASSNGCKELLAALCIRLHCLFTWFPVNRTCLIWIVLHILHRLEGPIYGHR